MRNFSTVLRPLRSKRALIAMAGAAAAAVNLVNTVGTQAATQDVATANASQVATQNFYPVPVAPTITCSNSGLSGSTAAVVSWGSAGAGYTYSWEEWKDNTTFVKATSIPGLTSGNINITAANGGYGNSFRIRVYTINPITTEKSTGYISFTVYSSIPTNAWCSGSAFGQENVSNWQQQAQWTPGAPATVSAQTFGGGQQPLNARIANEPTPSPSSASASPSTTTSAQSSSTANASTGTTTAAPTTTSTPTTSHPTTTTTTTTAPSTTTSTTPTTTTPTTTTTTSSTAASTTSAH